MSERAHITPQILRWARESARMSLEAGASKVNVKSERLTEWEEGVSQPTIKQAETLAKAYRRPFALFFLPDIPRDFQPLNDFRRDNSRELSTGSIFIIREVRQKQAWISDVLQEEGMAPLPFVGKYSSQSNPVEVANYILKTLDVHPSNYLESKPLKEWILKAEAKGIFISRSSFIHSRMKLDSDEFQGFAIADPYAPFVFINSEDWPAPQLFTLVHEIAHIIIAESGISNEIDVLISERDGNHPVELFCNEVAANALMPKSIMNQVGSSVFQSAPAIFSFARSLGVSSYAFLVRALNMGLISSQKYGSLKVEADRDFREFLKREEEKKLAAKQNLNSSGPSPYMMRTLRNGRLFTQMVLSAFRGGRIQPTEASTLLNTPVNNFPKLERYLYT